MGKDENAALKLTQRMDEFMSFLVDSKQAANKSEPEKEARAEIKLLMEQGLRGSALHLAVRCGFVRGAWSVSISAAACSGDSVERTRPFA